jgi:NtrC-family two-component system response regulator AlgB
MLASVRVRFMQEKRDNLSLNILVVDDEINIRKTLSVCLETDGHSVIAVSNYQDAVAEAARRAFDLAFVDLRLGTASGLDLIPALLAVAPWLKVIVITAYASIDTAVAAIQRGASDYVPKPFTPDQIRLAVDKVAQVRALEQKLAALQEDILRLNPEVEFTSNSPAMQRALSVAQQAAPSDASILIQGESGTGKTVLARAIHGWSRRAGKPMGVVSCLLESELFGHVKGAFTGAVRDNAGRIAACAGGTLLLDEIGDLPLSLQPKLLRFLQDHEYEHVGASAPCHADVRVVAATNMDLGRAVQEGRFREDLYYRLNVIQVNIPSLRERPEDIPSLAARLLVFFGRSNHRASLEFAPESLNALVRYAWPGNVRELRNVVERAVILCPNACIGVEHLPETLAQTEPMPRIGDSITLQQIEEQHIRCVLAVAKNLQEAADTLGIDQATLWRKRKQYGI